jgi:hypothetical protein
MKLLGGLAGTLMAVLALTWVMQGDSFFLSIVIDQAINRVHRAVFAPRGLTEPSDAEVPAVEKPSDTRIAPPPARVEEVSRAPQRRPDARPAPAPPSSANLAPKPPGPVPPGASSMQPRTDGQERIITVTRTGPIVEQPGRSGPPLLVVNEGTGLKLLDIQGEWFKVEYIDRKRGGARVGYIQLQYVRANPRRQ